MKNILKISLIALLTAGACVYLFREPLKNALYARLTQDMFVAADTDSFDPGPALGSQFPGIRARYRGDELRLITPFAGSNGTVFIASRSLDWCPYCMRQLIQLQQRYSRNFLGLPLDGLALMAPSRLDLRSIFYR